MTDTKNLRVIKKSVQKKNNHNFGPLIQSRIYMYLKKKMFKFFIKHS